MVPLSVALGYNHNGMYPASAFSNDMSFCRAVQRLSYHAWGVVVDGSWIIIGPSILDQKSKRKKRPKRSMNIPPFQKRDMLVNSYHFWSIFFQLWTCRNYILGVSFSNFWGRRCIPPPRRGHVAVNIYHCFGLFCAVLFKLAWKGPDCDCFIDLTCLTIILKHVYWTVHLHMLAYKKEESKRNVIYTFYCCFLFYMAPYWQIDVVPMDPSGKALLLRVRWASVSLACLCS